MSLCDCGQQFRWVVMARTGKRMPVDPAPDGEKGNLMELVDGPDVGKFVTLGGSLLAQARAEGSKLFVPHFATCPNADRHRRG